MTSRKLTASITAALVLTAALASLLFFFPDAPDRWSRDSGDGETRTSGDARVAGEGAGGEATGSGLAGASVAVEESAGVEERDAEEASEEQGPVSLSGTVTDTRGEPIEDARVAVSRAEEWSSVLERATVRFEDPISAVRWVEGQYREFAERCPSTRTDAGGAYSFRRLGPGEYRVVVSHPEHVPETDARALVPEAGEARCDVELVRGRVITGRVVDEEGREVEGAEVSARSSESNRTRGFGKMLQTMTRMAEGVQLLGGRETRSGPDGTFRLASLEPVMQDILARKDGFVPGEVRKVPPGMREVIIVLAGGASVAGRVIDFGGEPLAGAAVEVAEPPRDFSRMNPMLLAGADIDFLGEKTRSVSSGPDGRFRVEGIEEGFYELSVSAGGLPPFREVIEVAGEVELGDVRLAEPVSISGVVQDASGLPVEGAKVRVTRQGRGDRRRAPVPAIAETESDARGRFRVAALEAGTYDLRVSKDDVGEAVLESVEAGRTDVGVVLGKGLTIRGKVLDAKDRLPVSEATVRLIGTSRSAATGDDGTFEIPGVGEESLRVAGDVAFLRVTHPDHAPAMERKKVGEPIEILLEPGRGLHGVVLDERGEPVPGARVWLTIPGIPDALLSMAPGLGARSVYTGEDGRFFLGVPAERGMVVEVLAAHPGAGRAYAGPFDPEELGESSPELELLLTEGARIEGRVTGSGGEPIDGARVRAVREVDVPLQMRVFVQILPPAAGDAAYTREDGSYAIEGLTPGTYRLEARAPGYATHRPPPLEVLDGAVRADLVLDPGASISGRVIDSEGMPLPGVEVVAVPELETSDDDERARQMARFSRAMQSASGLGVSSTRTAGEGYYELAHLPEGTFLVVARAPGFLPDQAEGVQGGEKAPDLVLRAFAVLSGQVLDRLTGAPVEGFEVRLEREREEEDLLPRRSEESFENAAGRFLFEDLPAGEYIVRVRSEGYAPGEREARLEPGRETEVVVELGRGGRIAGLVIDRASREPIAGVSLRLHGNRTPGESRAAYMDERGTRAGEDGRFEFSGIPEGEYRVGPSHTHYFFEGDPQSLRVNVVEGETSSIEIGLARGARVRGKVSSLPRREPGRGFRLAFERLEPEEPPGGERSSGGEGSAGRSPPARPRTTYAWVGREGEYSADGIRPGRYQVFLEEFVFNPSEGEERGAGSRRFVAELEVEAGETRDLDADAAGKG